MIGLWAPEEMNPNTEGHRCEINQGEEVLLKLCKLSLANGKSELRRGWNLAL